MEMNMKFIRAEQEEAEEIMGMYRAAMGSEGCTWCMEYPNQEVLENDLKRKDLFCMKSEAGEILGAISIDDDPEIEELGCWSPEQQPGAELARLVVKEAYQNQSIARKLLLAGMKELKKRGYKSVHFLVSKTNYRAIRSYGKLQFEKRGEAELYGECWWCYEKEL